MMSIQPFWNGLCIPHPQLRRLEASHGRLVVGLAFHKMVDGLQSMKLQGHRLHSELHFEPPHGGYNVLNRAGGWGRWRDGARERWRHVERGGRHGRPGSDVESRIGHGYDQPFLDGRHERAACRPVVRVRVV